MIATRLLPALGLGFCLVLSRAAAAQNDAPPRPARGTELGLFAGLGSNATHTGITFGGAAGWQVTPWLNAEARGAWLARGEGATAFQADLGVATMLIRRRALTPYVGAGFGLYRATFDSTRSPMSEFYRRRHSGSASFTTERTFTDPAIRVSAGLERIAFGQVTIRPEATALFVRRDGHGEAIGLVSLRLGYRFEDRPVTPHRLPASRD